MGNLSEGVDLQGGHCSGQGKTVLCVWASDLFLSLLLVEVWARKKWWVADASSGGDCRSPLETAQL